MPLLKRTSEDHHESSQTDSISQDNRSRKRSKKVPERVRQSAFKDKQIIGKMRSFRVPAHMLDEETSVAHPTPSIPAPLTASTDTAKADNDNIPVWALTGDVVKAVAATAALQIAEEPAYPFVFNLTQEAEAKALAHPRSFLESLKRSFDKQLARAGIRLPYWFAIDISDQGRLHIQGVCAAVAENEVLKEVMRRAWGRWPGAGAQFQIWIDRKPCDDGWATYCLRRHRRVSKKIGQTFTVTRPLQRDAQWTYEEIRRIMAASCNFT
ncbi:hypothetical protein [Bradyrhizobium sp. DASA03120]|uniref:hypothetical protein n=1 Tax=Bradyrhizobium sp. SMVTL-02 TaxID=3395917 RepID=UPI003F6EC4AE